MNHPDIRYFSQDQIDRKKWDQCIGQSPNAIVYAHSWYLDRVASQWDALIFGDYLYVMPLVWNRKWRIHYVYQPFFTQQLGVFSPFPIDPEMVNSFLHSIPEKFKLIEMKMNEQNLPSSEKFIIQPHHTFHLHLFNSNEDIRDGYNQNTKRNLKQARQNGLHVSSFFNVDEFIDFTQANLRDKTSGLKNIHFASLKRLIGYAIYQRQGELLGVFNQKNQLIAATFFVWDKQRVIYLAASSSQEGNEKKAMFLLVDQFIESRAGQPLLLDFEGSDIPGIARFYKGFGATEQTYFSVRNNRLPSILRLLKP